MALHEGSGEDARQETGGREAREEKEEAWEQLLGDKRKELGESQPAAGSGSYLQTGVQISQRGQRGRDLGVR